MGFTYTAKLPRIPITMKIVEPYNNYDGYELIN